MLNILTPWLLFMQILVRKLTHSTIGEDELKEWFFGFVKPCFNCSQLYAVAKRLVRGMWSVWLNLMSPLWHNFFSLELKSICVVIIGLNFLLIVLKFDLHSWSKYLDLCLILLPYNALILYNKISLESKFYFDWNWNTF